jgi:hypothetical protein
MIPNLLLQDHMPTVSPTTKPPRSHMTKQEQRFLHAEDEVRELTDEQFVKLVTAEVEERNDNAMSMSEARKNATRVANFLTTLLEFDAA